MRQQWMSGLAAITLLAMLPAADAGVVSHYNVNGRTVTEGATFEEVRAIAGDPVERSEIRGSRQEVEWVYLCRRPGAGRCTVVSEDGKKQMRVRFRNGRMKSISFQRTE